MTRSKGHPLVLVQTESLTKQYGDFVALDRCNLHVARGEVFGLLGPNGAGKTTLLRLLMGFLKPTSGRAVIDGLDCHHQSLLVRQRVAYLPGDARLFRSMRGWSVLKFFSEIRPGGDLQYATQLAERLELDLSRRVAFMSTGMRQKLALAAVMSVDTPLVILDEPTSNLDPTVRAEVMRMVLEARERDRTVLFSSHILSEIEEVCDRVVFLRAGHLVRTQAMLELRRRHRIRAVLSGTLPPAPEELAGELAVYQSQGNRVTIDTAGELSPLLGWLSQLPIEQVNVEPIGLRAIYDEIHHPHRTEVPA